MFKYLFLIFFIILLEGCQQERPISYRSYLAINCESKEEFKKKYIFNKKNGYLYFYDSTSNDFLPLNKIYEEGYYGELFNEIYSKIDRNKLKITKLNYESNSNNGFFMYEDVINLNSLILKRTYKGDKNKFVTLKMKCIWIDPRVGIK